jgi:hypothetical protein
MSRFSLFSVGAVAAALVVAVLGAGYQPAAAQTTAPSPMMTPAQMGWNSPAAELRMQLHQLLSEHTVLAGMVTQKAAIGAPDFAAAMAQLDENSVNIANTVGGLYGPQAADQFLPMWRAHIQAYLDYTAATAREDEVARMAITEALAGWVRTMGAQMSALNPNLSRDVLDSDLSTHVNGTLMAINTFGAGDFDGHYNVAHQAFEHSFHMGDNLAAAIVAQFPDRFMTAASLPR